MPKNFKRYKNYEKNNFQNQKTSLSIKSRQKVIKFGELSFGKISKIAKIGQDYIPGKKKPQLNGTLQRIKLYKIKI